MSDSGLPKFCVFCGSKPDGKTREHIVPRWLIELTGAPGREAAFGLDWSSPKLPLRKYAWSAFAFPACGSCNHRWSDAESRSRAVVLKMLESGPLCENELHELLDWIDKVRTGLWLGLIYLNKNYRGLIPQFHIDDRVGAQDRALVILRSVGEEIGIGLTAIDTPVFHKAPSVFGLTINNLHFLSISSPFLVARRFGWPYAVDKQMRDFDTDGFIARLEGGTEEVSAPVFDWPSPDPCTVLAQPIGGRGFREDPPAATASLYSSDYITAHSREGCVGTGKVHLCGATATPYPTAESASWLPAPAGTHPEVLTMMTIWAAARQRELYADVPDLSRLSRAERKEREDEVAGVLRLHDLMLESTLKQIGKPPN